MDTVEYAPGRLADVFGDPAAPQVLLWHGMQSNARASMRMLARILARGGANVVVPDWDSHAADSGRADLLNSISFVRERTANKGGFVLVGWSMGGAAAAGLSLNTADFEVVLARCVCLAGAFGAEDPITGRPVLDQVRPDRVGVPFTLVHGVRDQVVPLTVRRHSG
jgi:pimeloyl-ACP methyl ester carboxylesterase